jgi:hypothetical protein
MTTDTYITPPDACLQVRLPNALLLSTHLEAWEGEGLDCPPGCITAADRAANYAYLARAINELLGTNFTAAEGVVF